VPVERRPWEHGAVSVDFSHLPADLPVPEDDGGADHLPGWAVPALALASTHGD
jgi:hypothetical protein